MGAQFCVADTFSPNAFLCRAQWWGRDGKYNNVTALNHLLAWWTHSWGKSIFMDVTLLYYKCVVSFSPLKNMFLFVHFKLVLVRLDMSPKYMSYSGPYYVWHFVCLRIHNSCLFCSLKKFSLTEWHLMSTHKDIFFHAYCMPLCSESKSLLHWAVCFKIAVIA